MKYSAPQLPIGEAAMTYDDIAATLGISRARVQFIERRALSKLARKLAHLAPGEANIDPAPVPSMRAELTPERRASADNLRWKPDYNGGQS